MFGLFKKKEPIREPKVGEIWYVAEPLFDTYGFEYQITSIDVRGVGYQSTKKYYVAGQQVLHNNEIEYKPLLTFLKYYKFLRDSV